MASSKPSLGMTAEDDAANSQTELMLTSFNAGELARAKSLYKSPKQQEILAKEKGGWTPPSDAVETSSSSEWSPPSDSVEASKVSQIPGGNGYTPLSATHKSPLEAIGLDEVGKRTVLGSNTLGGVADVVEGTVAGVAGMFSSAAGNVAQAFAEGGMISPQEAEAFTKMITYNPRTAGAQQVMEAEGKAMEGMPVNDLQMMQAATHYQGKPKLEKVPAKPGSGDVTKALQPKTNVDETKPQAPPANPKAAEWKAKSPLVETGIRNKTTGEVTPTGPKHPEELKADPNNEPVFRTKDGQVLSRKEAQEQAKRSGQILPDHPLENPEEGLHSGDLRAAGDSRFNLPEEPSKESPQRPLEAPTTNDLPPVDREVATPPEKPPTEAQAKPSRTPLEQWRYTGTKHDPVLSNIKTIGEGLDHIIQTYGPNHFASLLAEKLKPLTSKTAVRVFPTRQEYVASHGNDKTTSLAYSRSGGSDPHIGLQDQAATNHSTFLHEVIHDALRQAMADTTTKYFKELQSLFKEIEVASKTGLSNEERQALNKVTQHILAGKLHELNAYGLTHPRVMEALAKLEMKQPKGFVSRFLKAIGDALGFNPKEHNALRELFRVTERGIKEAEAKKASTSSKGITSNADKIELTKTQDSAAKEEMKSLWADGSHLQRGAFAPGLIDAHQGGYLKDYIKAFIADSSKKGGYNKPTLKDPEGDVYPWPWEEAAGDLPKFLEDANDANSKQFAQELEAEVNKIVEKHKGITSNSESIERPVHLDDREPPKYLYHGTRRTPEIDAKGNLILRPSKNYGGKTTSVSLTHDQNVADDYATWIKGSGPDAYVFKDAKTIKIHSDALPEGISRESGEEWAFNTDKPITIPKGKYEVVDHPLSKDGGIAHKEFYDYLVDNYGEYETESIIGDGREGELKYEYAKQQVEENAGTKLAAKYQAYVDSVDKLKSIRNDRISGKYKEPSVEWNKESTDDSHPLDVPRDVRSVPPEDVDKHAQALYDTHGEEAASKFMEDYKRYQETWIEPVKETERVVGINIQNKLAKQRVINNLAKDFEEAVPNKAERESISHAIDQGAEHTLTGKSREVAARFKREMKDIGKRALDEGVIKNLAENYITYIVDWTKEPKSAQREFIDALLGTARRDPSMSGMKTDSKYGKPHKYETFDDLQAALKDSKLQLRTTDIAEIYKAYATSMEKAIENKQLIDKISTIRNAAGESLVKDITPESPLPHGWEAGQGQLAGKAIHPDLKPALDFVFDAGPGDIMKALGTVSQLVKRLNVVGSFFHAKSLMEVISSAEIPIWTPIKEVGLGAVDKLTGSKHSGLTKAVDQYRKGGLGDNVDTWIKSGMQLDAPEDVSRGILTETGKFADAMISKYGPQTHILEKSLSQVEKYTLGLFDKFTWDYLHTGGKIMVADSYLTKARLAAAKEGKPFNELQSRQQIARFVNDSFGGLNWFDAATQTHTELGKRLAQAAYNPKGRRALQVMLFAPDWTISTVRAFASALPDTLNPRDMHPIEGIKGMRNPKTKQDYARLYQLKTALTYLTLLNAINQITANRNIWENKDPTRIEFKDGTSMQAMKHAMEPYHWIMDPDKTFSNKLGFLPKAAVVGIAGVEYASPTAQKLVDPSATGRMKAVSEMIMPFQAQAASNAPEGEGAKRALLGTMGFPLYGQTPAERKQAKALRSKKLKEAAKEYHKEAKRRGWE